MNFVKKIKDNLIKIWNNYCLGKNGKSLMQNRDIEKSVICFFPKDSNCAVEKLYWLLKKFSSINLENFKILYSTNYKKHNFDEENLHFYAKIIIFGHYPSPKTIPSRNLFYLQPSFIAKYFKGVAIYGHICFGNELFDKANHPSPLWISYSGFLKLIFGLPPTDQRIVVFFENLFEVIHDNKGGYTTLKNIENTYINELIFLKQNKGKVIGYNILYSLMYKKFKMLNHFT